MGKNNDSFDGKITKSLMAIVNVYGFWGALFIVWVLCLWVFPNKEQKQQFFDMYFLMKWDGNYLCIIVPVLLSTIVFFAQAQYYKNKYANKILTLNGEIDRIVEVRNQLQEKLARKEFETSKKKKGDIV